MAPVAPNVVVPAARHALRQLVGHLVVDARPAQLTRTLKALRSAGVRLNLNLLGEAVLGDREAASRLEGTMALLAREDVDYVSIKISAVVNQLDLWAHKATVDEVVEQLLPLYHLAENSPKPKFINLDMEEYHDLDLTMEVFQKLLDTPNCVMWRLALSFRPTCPTRCPLCKVLLSGLTVVPLPVGRGSKCGWSRAPISRWRR